MDNVIDAIKAIARFFIKKETSRSLAFLKNWKSSLKNSRSSWRERKKHPTPTNSENVMTFEIRSEKELETFKKEITELKTSKGVEKTGTIERIGGNLYFYKPFNSGERIYLRRITVVPLKEPTLSSVANEVFGKRSGKTDPSKFAREEFRKEFERNGGRFERLSYRKCTKRICRSSWWKI